MKKERNAPLTKEQIGILKKNGCHAVEWERIIVSKDFDPKKVRSTVFEGDVKIGGLKGTIQTAAGDEIDPGIRNARLCNITIGDTCLISNVHGRLMNLDIEDEVWIENVGTIICTGTSSFGNGHEIKPLNEGGGRELFITEKTSAQVAYFTVMYRHEKEFIKKLDTMAKDYAKTRQSGRARIEKKACVMNSTLIENVYIGSYAIVNGVASLKNGTVVSSKEAPTTVGNGVIAENFIFQKGSGVKQGAILFDTLVGEATQVGKQFSAENSLFFSNSECFHSEVCSVFAGPYTVTHHRATLLIAGYFSFYNAGSGSNQSNHMYKLGPVHQGILERGCKTGSFSYLLWPCRVGAFTPVLGKHYSSFDTSEFPFSYIDEENGKSTLVPGMNFFTVGTMRDAEKWPARDRRKNSDKLDLIIFDVLSPYTAQKMINGEKILAELYEKEMKELYDAHDRKPEYVAYNGIHIKRLLLKTCKRYYKLIVSKYFGDVLLERVQRTPFKKIKDIVKFDPRGTDGKSRWIDVCGLLCDSSRVEKLIRTVRSGEVCSIESLQKALKEIYDAFEPDEWNWFIVQYKNVYGRDLAGESDENLKSFIDEWKTASLKLINMVLNDAEKEFDETARVGFGIDGEKSADFGAVRGTGEENAFVEKLKKEIMYIEKRYSEVMKCI